MPDEEVKPVAAVNGPPTAAVRAAWWRRWLYPTAALLLAVGLKLWAAFFPGAVESIYSRPIYPYIALAQSWINRWFGFSLVEFLIIALILLLIGYVGRMVWLLVRRHRPVLSTLGTIAFRGYSIVAWGLLFFVVAWGLNYDRQPIALNLNLPRRDASTEELTAISRYLIEQINLNYLQANASVGPDGGTLLPMDRAALAGELNRGFEQQAENLLLRGNRLGSPKPVVFSRVLTRMGITGVYNPFTGEANFDREVHAVELPFVLAHEMAHQRGFAREDEANFVAFVVCTNSENAYVRYSGYYNARSVLRVLLSVSPTDARAIAQSLGPGPRADEAAVRAFWRQHLGQTSAATNYVNDKYLKANRISNGTNNYLDSNALVIAYYLKVGW